MSGHILRIRNVVLFMFCFLTVAGYAGAHGDYPDDLAASDRLHKTPVQFVVVTLMLTAVIVSITRYNILTRPQAIGVFLVGTLLLGGIWMLTEIESAEISSTFQIHIDSCNAEPPQARFSCYRAALEHTYGDNPSTAAELPAEALSFEGDNPGYAFYGTNCHTFHHALGDFLAEHMIVGDIQPASLAEAQRYNPTTCTSGAIMGWGNRMAMHNNFSTEWLKRFIDTCREEEKNTCAHEVGHLMADKHLASHLRLVDVISREEYGLEPRGAGNYVLFGENLNFTAAFDECEEIVGDGPVKQCYTGIGHNQFIYSQFNNGGYDAIFDQCRKFATGEDADNCRAFLLFRIGINEAAPAMMAGNMSAGNKICREATARSGRESLGIHCYRGIGGGIGLHIESAYGKREITEDNFVLMRERLQQLADLCKQTRQQDQCYIGLLGTQFRDWYINLNMYDTDIKSVLDKVESGFAVVG